MKLMPILLVALVPLFSGCGGGSDAALSTRERADSAELRARALLQTQTCSAAAQCSFVTFEDAYPSCSQGRHEAYLPASRNARAAEQAASQQRALAREAKFAPGNVWDFGCVASVEPLPLPVCNRGQCELRSGFQVIEFQPQ